MRLGLTLAFVTLAAAPVAAQAPALPAAHPPFTLERTEQRPLDVPVNNEHDAQLRGQSLPKLRYAFHVVEGEAHAGSKPEAFNRGLRFALRPYMDRPGAGK